MKLETINATVEFDIFDLDQSEAFEKAIDQLSWSEKKIQDAGKNGKMSAMNRAMLDMFKAFFVTATGVDVLKDCKNSMTAQSAYYEFCEIVGESKLEIVKKYNPKRVR